MAHLHLHLSSFSCSLGIGEAFRNGWRANWKAGMGWDESVKLSTGSDLSNMAGWLNLKVAPENWNSEEKAIGALSYFPASPASDDGVSEAQPDTYYVEAFLPEAELMRLMELERHGHGPTGVSVDVPELKYGVFPDGSDKKWELDEKRNWLAIEGLTFSFSKPEPEEEDDYDDEVAEVGPSPEAQALQLIHRDLQKWMPWAFVLLIAILSALLFKR